MKKILIVLFSIFTILLSSKIIVFSSDYVPLITLYDEHGRAEYDMDTGKTRYLDKYSSNSAEYSDAVNLYNKCQYSLALNKLNQILQRYPHDAPSHMLKSQIEYTLDKYDDAIQSANRLLVGNSDVMPRLWRLYICAESGNEKYLNLMYSDIVYVLNTNSDYTKKALNGEFNSYIGDIIDNKNIPSTMKSKIYKYVISYCNKKYGNVYSVPMIASYIQFIYGLDDNDVLFKTLGKTKSGILQSYINVAQGQYRDIIIGIYTVASGNKEKGSNQILIGFKKIDTDHSHVGYALNILNNSMRLLRPDKGFYWLPEFVLKDGSKVTNNSSYKRIIKSRSSGMLLY